MAGTADPSPAQVARSAGRGFASSTAFEGPPRAGFVARGLIYGIIGLLAFEVAVSDTGKLTNQQGALATVADQPLGGLLLVLLTVGLGGYAIWRLLRLRSAMVRRGRTARSNGSAGLGAALCTEVLCIAAIRILTGSPAAGPSSTPDRTTAGVFDWPAGRWLVGLAGIVLLGVAAYQLVKGARRSFLEELDTGQMTAGMEDWITWIGTIGHVARAIVFGLVGWFLLKAAYEFDAKEAVGLDGALTKILQTAYGPWLLGFVAAGLVAFGVYLMSEARYRRV
jgi:uncharacterized membrane protein YidH (DUF202 family)